MSSTCNFLHVPTEWSASNSAYETTVTPIPTLPTPYLPTMPAMPPPIQEASQNPDNYPRMNLNEGETQATFIEFSRSMTFILKQRNKIK